MIQFQSSPYHHIVPVGEVSEALVLLSELSEEVVSQAVHGEDGEYLLVDILQQGEVGGGDGLHTYHTHGGR